jgi:hypothetical protein
MLKMCSKVVHLHFWTDPRRFKRFVDNRHKKMATFSTLRTGRLFSPSPGRYHWYSFPLEADLHQCHSEAGRIISMKNFNDTIGNLRPGVAWWLRRGATSRKVPGSIPGLSIGTFSEASDKSMCPGSTQTFEMSTTIFLGVKTAGT